MNRPQPFGLALGLIILLASLGGSPVEAAKKYYPPGFTPPSNQSLVPSGDAQSPKVIVQPGPGDKQVIIRTVPQRPRDPLTVLIEERRFYEALRMLEGCLRKAPGNTSLHLAKAQLLRDSGSFEEAMAEFQRIHDGSRNRYTRAAALNGLGWTCYQAALRARNAGDAEGRKTMLSSAETAFRQSIRLNASQPHPWTGLAEWAMENGLLPEARASLRKAALLAPADLNVKLAQARLLLTEGKVDDALAILYGLKRSASHTPQVYLLLAKASLEKNRVDDAIIDLKQLLEIVPEHTQALKLLSVAYERKMKPEDARDSLEKAVAINPADAQSVQALLKIYDQGDEPERALLLLKTLLKEAPGQRGYQRELLGRLQRAQRWDELYETGERYLDAALSPADNPAREDLDAMVAAFAQAAFHQRKGLINLDEFQARPVIRKVQAYLRARLAEGDSPQNRLSLLYIDPLADLPPEDPKTQAQAPEAALKAAFLQGRHEAYQSLMADWEAAHAQLDDSDSVRQALQMACDLLMLGDYAGAERIARKLNAAHPQAASAQGLLQNIETARMAARDQVVSLEMLPRRIPESYWQKAASEALRLGSANWKTHALLAECLADKNQLSLALQHQKLAARYAPTEKERARWEKKAARTERQLQR